MPRRSILALAAVLFAVHHDSALSRAAQSTSPLKTAEIRCETLVLYEVCADLRLARQAAAGDASAFDLGRAEALEIDGRLRSLSRGANVLTPVRADDARRRDLEPRWNEKVRPAIARISLYGGVAFLDGREFFVLFYPPLAVTPRRELGRRFHGSARFNQVGRLMFATEPVARIDVSRRPAVMEVSWPPLRRICENLVDNKLGPDLCAEWLIQYPRLPFQYPDLTVGPVRVLDVLTMYYVRIWQFALYVSEFKNHALLVPRRVFAFSATESASPSVDRFGNLYVPDTLARSGQSDGEKLDLVMWHEAAHVELLGQEFTKTATTLFMNEVAQQAVKAAKDVPPDAANRLLPLYRLARSTDESLADMLALKQIGNDRDARRKYQALVQELETVSAGRNTALKMICEYLDAGGEVDRLLVAHAVALQAYFTTDDPERARATLSKYDSTNDWPVATRLAQIHFKEFNKSITGMLPDVLPKGQEPNPWTFERQLQDFYERVLKQLRSQRE